MSHEVCALLSVSINSQAGQTWEKRRREEKIASSKNMAGLICLVWKKIGQRRKQTAVTWADGTEWKIEEAVWR